MKALAPRLRHRITFQSQQEVRDSEGAVSIEWANAWLDSETELADVPAEVLTGPGREFNAGGQVQAETTARINLRWFPGLDPEWRILWDGHVYNIGSIETDATARREYRLRCTGGVNDGQ
jgi:SPP1 family predicted phage head-tail adaptor